MAPSSQYAQKTIDNWTLSQHVLEPQKALGSE